MEIHCFPQNYNLLQTQVNYSIIAVIKSMKFIINNKIFFKKYRYIQKAINIIENEMI